MEWMSFLTGFGALYTIVCGWILWRCTAALERAQDAERACRRAEGRLTTLRGEILGAVAGVESLEARFRKLQGLFYSLKQPKTAELDNAELEKLPLEEKNALVRQQLRAQHGLPKVGKNGA